MRKVRLFGKAVSPLALVGVFVAVAALVGASVILTSPTKTANYVTINDTEAIILNLNDAPSGTYYATDSDGVSYAWSIYVPKALSTATITITIKGWDTSTDPKWSDIGAINATLVSGGTGSIEFSATGSSYTLAPDSSLTYTYTLPQNIPAGWYTGSLNVIYNIPGSFAVSASVSGTTA